MSAATRVAVAAIVAWASAAACAKSDDSVLTGIVTRVSDGDTLWVRPVGDTSRRKPVKLRMLGIDAPERCQAGGPAATAALTARALHRTVVVRVVGSDRYGRRLGQVRIDGVDLGASLVRAGHAWSHRHHGAAVYAAEEREARRARRGLFADAGAIEPRVFRERHGPCP